MARLRRPPAWRLRGRPRSLSTIVLGCAILVGTASLATRFWTDTAHERSENRLLYVQALTDKFDAVVFHGEDRVVGTPDRVHKWTGPIRIVLDGEAGESFRPVVARHATTMAALTALDVDLLERADGEETLVIHVLSEDRLDTLAARYGRAPAALRTDVETNVCSVILLTDESGVIVAAGIIVDVREVGTRYSVRQIRACLIEHLTRSLGLPGPSALLRPSVFDPQEEWLQDLTVPDRLLVETLYDPRLQAGQSRTEASRLAGEIIADSLAAPDR